MTIPEIITSVKDVLLGAAAIIASTVAIIGLNNWLRELKGKTEFEIARGLIKATYKLRDELRMCRSPFVSAMEFPESYNRALRNHSPEEEAQAWAHVYKNRWQPVWSALQDFDAQTLEAEALWGNEIRKKTDEFRQSIRELNVAIEAVIANKASGGEDFRVDRDLAKEMRMRVSATKDDENQLTKQIANAIKNIEKEVRPHLKRI